MGFRLVSYSFGEKASPALKTSFLDHARPHMPPSCQELASVSISASELLNAAVSALARLPDAPLAHLPNVPHVVRCLARPCPHPVQDVSVIEMLKKLDRTLTQLPQSLPPVVLSVKKA